MRFFDAPLPTTRAETLEICWDSGVLTDAQHSLFRVVEKNSDYELFLLLLLSSVS